jgi:3-oxoacyl-[acyl-carrier-protein] synthase II
MTRRVVITGLGTVCPIATDTRTYWQGLLAGKSGIGPITLIDTTEFKVKFGGECKLFDPDKYFDSRAARRLDRFAQFAMAAASEALQDSGLDLVKEDPFRCGAVVGSGIGGLTEYEEQHTKFMQGGGTRGISPFTIPKMMPNSAAGNISIHYGLCGPSTAVSTACASAADAIGDALHRIQRDEAEVMVSGGAEAAITYMGLGGFISARALSLRNDNPQAASRPFDKDRDGFVLSEGAGILVLEEMERAKSRGAPIYAEVMACGNSADAFHITAPHDEGVGAAEAMRAAIREAGWNLTEVEYLNAHGTSTPLGDAAETKAVKKVFGDHARRLMISSTKSLIGHLLGASGGVETIACCLSLKHGILHPTINLENQDIEGGCDLDYIANQPREVRVRKVLSNSFGFGGHNCSLALAAV